MDAMRRLRIAWVLSLSLMVAGALVAHAVAYRLVDPARHMDGGMRAEEAHGYVGDVHACLAMCGALLFLAAFAALVGRARAGRRLLAPLWAFAVVPPLGFTIQEHLEHVFETGSFPHTAALDPAFLVGLVLQLPFAFAAYFAGRAVLALAMTIVDAFRVAPSPPVVACDAHVPTARTGERVRPSVLALGYGQRAPPPRLA